MEGSPQNKDIEKIKKDIFHITGVISIVEMRVWNITESKTILSAKILLDRYSPTALDSIKNVCNKHKIYHNTIEILIR